MRLNFPATALLATLVAGGAFADDPVRENSRGARSSRIFRGPGMDETGRLAMRLTRLEQRLAHADRTIRVLRRRINRLESNPVMELGPFVSIESADLNELSGPHVLLTGVNLHVRSGSGFTDDEGQLRELGNVIVGYNERRRGVCSSTGSGLTIVQRCAADEECRGGDCVFGENARQGSHNLVIGPEHFYPSFGGLVAGRENTVEGEHSSVVGGQENEAVGEFSSVTGGWYNSTSGSWSSVSGGFRNRATGRQATVSGGHGNIASGYTTTVGGGGFNASSGFGSTVCGGAFNISDGISSAILGGHSNEATGSQTSIVGGRKNHASDFATVVVGGEDNVADERFEIEPW